MLLLFCVLASSALACWFSVIYYECALCLLNEFVLSSFHIMSWLNCATFACMSHYITLLFTLNNSFVVRSCKNLVTLLINFLCYVLLCCVVLCCVVLCCVVLCCVVLCCVVLCCVVLCCVVLCCVVLCCVVLCCVVLCCVVLFVFLYCICVVLDPFITIARLKRRCDTGAVHGVYKYQIRQHALCTSCSDYFGHYFGHYFGPKARGEQQRKITLGPRGPVCVYNTSFQSILRADFW